MVEGVVGVVLGLDLGESLVNVIAVGLSNAAGVVVGIEEVDVAAVAAMRFEGFEEPARPRGLDRGDLAGFFMCMTLRGVRTPRAPPSPRRC